jgi:hypothetical protein
MNSLRFLRRAFFAVFMIWTLGALPSAAEAQEGFAWEYTPYQIQVWIAADGAAIPTATQRDNLQLQLSSLFEIAGLSEWTADVKWMPQEANWAPGEPLANLTAQRLRAASKDILLADKLFLVQLDGGTPLRASASEFDLHLRNWSDLESIDIENEVLLADSIFKLILRAFRPIIQLENPNEKLIWGRPRAIKLAVAENSPIRIALGDVLAPATRYNDRAGEPLAKDGVVPAEWTRLKVKEIRNDRVLCDIYSGLRNPFRRRMGVRSERYALLVRPRFASTKLSVVKRSEGAEPLIDYEIYDKPFSLEAEPKLLGRTDFLGQIEIPADSTASLKLLYVKCGNQLLARLPIVPGESPLLTVPIGDDEVRLQAEGFILGIQSATMDAYARRLELAARFKRRLEAGKFDEAEQMIAEARKLPNRAQLMQALDQRETSFTTTNPRIQSRIDYLFGEGRKLLNAFPDADLTIQLNADLAKAKAAPAAPPTAPK